MKENITNNDLQAEIALDVLRRELIENPTVDLLKQAKLAKRYPEFDWRNDFDGTLKKDVWYGLSKEEQLCIIKEIPAITGFLKKTLSPLLSQDITRYNQNEIEKATQVYLSLVKANKVQDNNQQNNSLIARVSLESTRTNYLTMWRFICLPEVELDTDTLEWNTILGTRRYDTLSPALSADECIQKTVRSQGLTPEIMYVVNDWEAPWLRSRSTFYSLNKNKQSIALQNLQKVRDLMSDWVWDKTKKSICYFSSLVTYDEFEELVSAMQIEDTSDYAGIFTGELNYVKESSPNLEFAQQVAKTKIRISQYAVEGTILAGNGFSNCIYLNAEYPLVTSWSKLVLLADLPTLFYVTDKEVKNV